MTEDLHSTELQLRRALTEATQQLRISRPAGVAVPERPTRRWRTRTVVTAIAATLTVIAVATAGLLAARHTTSAHRPKPPTAPTEVAPTKLLQTEANLVVYMNVDAPNDETEAVRQAVRASPEVAKFAFVDHTAAYREFQKAFSNNPDLVNTVDRNALPQSIRVIARHCSDVPGLIVRFQQLPGIDDVTRALGVSHAAAKKLGYKLTFPPVTIKGTCGQHYP